MSFANKPLSITDLCDDLLCQIFDRLSVKKVLAIQTVNKDFHRSAEKWLQTVDRLVVDNRAFYLQKTFGKQSKWSEFSLLFPSLDKMLTVCTGIKIVEFRFTTELTLSQLIQQLSRCQQLSCLTLSLYKHLILDDDWTRLVQLVKHCDVHLEVYCKAEINLRAEHLEQLFTSARRIKSVFFIGHDNLDTFLKTLVLLDESVEVKLFLSFPNASIDDEVCDIISRRVDKLTINSENFQKLSIRRFEKLSHLRLNGYGEDFPVIPTVGFPRLKSLKVVDNETDGPFMLRFFAAACQLDQLERLKLYGLKKDLIEDEHLTEMLAKTPNITKLKIRWNYFSPTDIPAFEKLFQLLSESLPRLRIVVVEIDKYSHKFIYGLSLSTRDCFRMTNYLVAFARRRPEVDLNVSETANVY